jgi:hypothetical protein
MQAGFDFLNLTADSEFPHMSSPLFREGILLVSPISQASSSHLYPGIKKTNTPVCHEKGKAFPGVTGP